MTIAMNQKEAEKWFGAAPPDLSLIARSKGADYVFAKLNTYYEDDKSLTGYNNLAYPIHQCLIYWQTCRVVKS